ncbi:MAG: hypothetical protein ACXV8K_08580 [Ilumatobacteraceae bacterium]
MAAIVVVGLGAAAIAYAAPASINTGASASRPAKRLNPPGPHLGGCPMFPADNAWNQEIALAPLRPRSQEIINKIQSIGGQALHPDFGENPLYGIPFVVVPATQPLVPIIYGAYGNESDPGPFPIPPNAPIEGGGGGGDSHVLVLQQGTCQLFELFAAGHNPDGSWSADSGARWDLTTGALRPIGWTSADAAGLPILPGLVRYDEVAAGAINHAIRVTFKQTQAGFVLPATHSASSRTDPTLPAMGMRLRLSASFDVTTLSGQARVIATAMQRYGLIVADNGSNWYFQGAPDPGWNDNDLNQLKSIPGTDFEVVDTGPVQAG